MTRDTLATSLSWLDELPVPGVLVEHGSDIWVRHVNSAAAGLSVLGGKLRTDQPLTSSWPELAAQLSALGTLPRSFRLRVHDAAAWIDVHAFALNGLAALLLSDVTAVQAAEIRSGALFDLTAALSRGVTAGEAAEVVLRHSRAALDAVTGAVFMVDDADDHQLVLAGAVGHDGTALEDWQRVPVETPSVLTDVLRAGEPLFLTTAGRDGWPPPFQGSAAVRTLAVLPLVFGGQSLGVMSVGFTRDTPLSAPERHFLLAVTEQLTQALERSRLFAHERRAHRTAALLFELTAALGRASTPEEVAEVIARASVPALGAAGGVVLELDTGRDELVVLSESGIMPAPLAGTGRFSVNLDVNSAASARTGQAIFLGTPEYRQRYPHLQGETPTLASAALPLFEQERLLGVLAYGWNEPHAFTAAERELLMAVAGQCAQALERTRRAAVERAQAQLLDLAQDAVIARNTAGEVTYWNPAAAALYGIARADAMGRITDDLLHTRFPVSRSAVNEALHAGDVWEGELIHTTREGREITVASRQSLRRDEHGMPVGALEINRDVTADRATQAALLASETRYRALIEATSQYVWTNSPEGEMVGDQPGWARLTGQTPDEYRGFGWAQRLHPDDREAAVSAWHEAVQTRSPYEIEQRVCVRDGTYRSFLVRAVPLLLNETEVHEWVGLHTDITELKRAEQTLRAWGGELERQVTAQTRELRAANEELGAFAYTVSHDLRAPVRHVASFAGLLRRKIGDDPTVLRYVDQIDAAATRMEVLTDALLGLARAGAAQLTLRDVSLQLLVDAARSDLGPEMTGRNITWQIGGLPTVKADVGLLRQVLTNLLGNAVKYSQYRDNPVIEMWADEAPGEVTIAVRDNGAGFDPQYASRLFGVFQRLHHQNEFEGTGVGLANVKRIVEKHGGRVWASSRPGEGATFFFSLPRS